MPSTMVRQGRRLRQKNVYTLVVQPSAEGLAFLNTRGLSPLAGVEDMENLKIVSYTHLDVYKRQV